MSFEGPRRRIVQAFGVLHSVKKVKYLIFSQDVICQSIDMNADLLITNFFNIKQTTSSANITFSQIFNPIDNRCTDGKSDAIIV